MNEIICPHCNKAFKIDEAGFADIVKQVRDHQFEEEILNRLALAEKEKEIAIHNYIIKNTKYDYENYLKGTVLKSSYNAYGALINATAVCQGYADAMKMLLNFISSMS